MRTDQPQQGPALQSIVLACSQEARRLNAMPHVDFARTVAGLLWDCGAPEDEPVSAGLFYAASRGSLNAVSALATLAHQTGDQQLTRLAGEAVNMVAARSAADCSAKGINDRPAGQA